MTDSIYLQSLDLDKLEHLAKLLSKQLQRGDIILLDGDLGAGKTTFTQYLATYMHVKENEYVSSPSYALLHEYSAEMPIYHMDLYRLTDEDDVENAGLLDYMNETGLCIIEWPDRLGAFFPNEYLSLSLQVIDEKTRNVELGFHGPRWEECRKQFLSPTATIDD